MGCILIQLDNSPESLAAVKHLHSTSEYIFDRTSSNLRLIPIFIISHSNFDHERYYYSFVSERTRGR